MARSRAAAGTDNHLVRLESGRAGGKPGGINPSRVLALVTVASSPPFGIATSGGGPSDVLAGFQQQRSDFQRTVERFWRYKPWVLSSARMRRRWKNRSGVTDAGIDVFLMAGKSQSRSRQPLQAAAVLGLWLSRRSGAARKKWARCCG